MEINGYENYLIYPDGRVSSKRFPDRFLKPGINRHNYYHVLLYKDGKRKTFKIHRLIAIHYIPNPENKPDIDHINRVRTDNRVENLRWVSSSENMQNTGPRCDNKLGYKNISFHKLYKYRYKKIINGKNITKCFNTLTDALCYKYIMILKIKSKLI